jgi:hypothetical protein
MDRKAPQVAQSCEIAARTAEQRPHDAIPAAAQYAAAVAAFAALSSQTHPKRFRMHE